MSRHLEHEDLEEFAGQFFDIAVNPLAEVVTKLLHLLSERGTISRDEAVGLIASSVGVIKGTRYSEAAKENGADMLMRMVRAIEPSH